MNVPRITKEQLLRLHEYSKAVPDINLQMAESYTACGVIIHMLGEQWFHDHILADAPNKSVLTLTKEGEGAKETIHQARVGDLAEMLFNLQDVEGFDECVRRLADGVVESTLAELDLGRLLRLHLVNFRYIVPISKKGSDYDVEIIYPNGVVACADAKCKIEGNAFSAKSLSNTLEKGRQQLPSDKPGIVFVKHPAQWVENRLDEIREITAGFFRSTQRIVSVKYYVQPFEQRGNYIFHRHGFLELNNPRTRFDPEQHWDVFPRGFLKDLTVPDHWQRIMNMDGRRATLPPDVQ